MYSVGFIHIDRDAWKAELQNAIATAVYRHTGTSSWVGFVEAEDADVVLCLGSPALHVNVAANYRIEKMLRRGLRVLPIVESLQTFLSQVPASLDVVNGMEWKDPATIADEVLRHLGLAESDRRVFLSYLRRETTALAHQFYDELHRRGFFVFLDSFEIEHGALVQARIEQALHETSFVLLLYSPSVESSGWVEKEINFALAHRLGLMALALPGAQSKMPFRMTPGDRRDLLSTDDFRPDGRLTDVALERACVAIEREHADQFRQRRDRLIEDVSEALGGGTVRVGMHSIRYEGSTYSALLRVNPRAPSARDLYLLDRDCASTTTIASKPLKRVLVAIKGGYREYMDLTQWACDELKHQVAWHEPQVLCADPAILERT
jgi:hypothetical protein